MPNVRPLNKRYGISKHAFLTAYSYCHQYREWHKALTSGAREDDHGSSVTEIEEKIRKIENTVGGGSAGLSCTLSVYAGVCHGGRNNLPADATEGNTMRQHAVLYVAPPLLLPDVGENISASLTGQGKRYDEHTGKKENPGTNRGSFSFAWRWRD